MFVTSQDVEFDVVSRDGILGSVEAVLKVPIGNAPNFLQVNHAF